MNKKVVVGLLFVLISFPMQAMKRRSFRKVLLRRYVMNHSGLKHKKYFHVSSGHSSRYRNSYRGGIWYDDCGFTDKDKKELKQIVDIERKGDFEAAIEKRYLCSMNPYLDAFNDLCKRHHQLNKAYPGSSERNGVPKCIFRLKKEYLHR